MRLQHYLLTGDIETILTRFSLGNNPFNKKAYSNIQFNIIKAEGELFL